MSIRCQKGITLIELLMVVSTIGVMVAAATAVSLPILAREQMRSALYDVQSFMQLAKIESVSKNR